VANTASNPESVDIVSCSLTDCCSS
jgi:hypothetical protein